MTVANYFTLFRLFISPVFLLIYLFYEPIGISYLHLPYILLGLIVVVELSDFCDGYLARKLNQVTDFGKIVDPMADTLGHLTYFFAFTQGVIQIPILLVFVFLYRDLVISALRTLCALRGFALAARSSGKLKAFTQMLAIISIIIALIPHSLGKISTETLQTFAFGVTALAAFFTFYSAFDYIYYNRSLLKIFLIKPKQ